MLRSDPLRELDRVLERTTEQFRKTGIPMDAYRHGDTFVIHFDLPGVDPDSIDIEVERNVLTLGVDRSWRPVDGDDVIAAERQHCQFRRQLLIGDGLDPDKMHVSYEQGVLTITLPVAERSKPRKFTINTEPKQEVRQPGLADRLRPVTTLSRRTIRWRRGTQ